jgi:DUF3102 family protein
MSNRADKAKLAAGAEKLRKAQAEASVVKAASKTKLDGALTAATKRLIELHDEIMAGVRATFGKAIEAGRILSGVRVSRKGKWLKWLDENVPFSQRTAYNYIDLYERRDQLKLANVASVSEAYALLHAPKRTPDPAVEELVAKGVARDERDARRILREQGAEEVEAEPEVEAPNDIKPPTT